MKFNKFIMLLMATFIFTPTLNAEPVYKWVDVDGHVHYGSKPKNKNAKELKIRNKYIKSGNAKPAQNAKERVKNTNKFLNALDVEKNSIAEVKRKKKEEEERNIIRCNASRDQLKRYEASGSLYDLDEKGNRILLNKKQYEQAMGQAKARVQKWCY